MSLPVRRPRRLSLLGPIAAVWLATVAAPVVSAGHDVTRDLWFPAAYEHQVDGRTCTAASTAMMVNLIAGRDLNLNQYAILRYEQPRDALNDSVQRGSDPLGWSRAVSYYSQLTPRPTIYRWEAYPTKGAALRRAAAQLLATGKPVGFTVQHGRHAVVMTGVSATGNPWSGAFTVNSLAISDPNGYSHRWYSAATVALNTYLETDATPWYDRAWYGKYVIIVPQG
jgi:hypothetical protein